MVAVGRGVHLARAILAPTDGAAAGRNCTGVASARIDRRERAARRRRLEVVVVAPAGESPIRAEPTGEQLADTHGRECSGGWRRLTEAVRSPTPERLVGPDGAGMLQADAHRRERPLGGGRRLLVVVRAGEGLVRSDPARPEAADRHVIERSIWRERQAAGVPTDRCTVHANGAGIPVPGTDDRIGPGGRERRVVFRPELVPPARDRSIPSNSAARLFTGRDRGERARRCARLHELVGSPARQGPVLFDCAGVVRTGADGVDGCGRTSDAEDRRIRAVRPDGRLVDPVARRPSTITGLPSVTTSSLTVPESPSPNPYRTTGMIRWSMRDGEVRLSVQRSTSVVTRIVPHVGHVVATSATQRAETRSDRRAPACVDRSWVFL